MPSCHLGGMWRGIYGWEDFSRGNARQFSYGDLFGGGDFPGVNSSRENFRCGCTVRTPLHEYKSPRVAVIISATWLTHRRTDIQTAFDRVYYKLARWTNQTVTVTVSSVTTTMLAPHVIVHSFLTRVASPLGERVAVSLVYRPPTIVFRRTVVQHGADNRNKQRKLEWPAAHNRLWITTAKKTTRVGISR